MNRPEYFDTQQAAKRYGLSASWLAKLRSSGGGCTFLKCGRRVLYDAASFESWLESHRRQNTSEN